MSGRPRLVGVNHVALEVSDVDRALAFWGGLFDITIADERSDSIAFIEIGDQFIALMKGRTQPPDEKRHFGLVVDDREATRRALQDAGVEILPGRFLDFLDPDGNQIQVVQYDQIQFTKDADMMRRMGLDPAKSDRALAELRAAGLRD